MDSTHANKVADLCGINGADSLYYGIYELFPNGGIACAGIMQHLCCALVYEKILNNQYEYCEIIDRPEIIIRQVDGDVVVQFMRKELHG